MTSQDIEQLANKVSKVKTLCQNISHEYIDSEKLVNQFSALESKVKGLNRKPVIGCFGAFDSGKSTFLNTIMGKQILPEDYQPATSLITLVMHTDDKPETIQGKVAIFKKGFFPHMIHSKECIDKYLIEEGDKDLLDKLGVHNYDEELVTDAYTAIVFENIELLKTVWLLDTPGDFNTADEEDTEKALVGLEVADIIIYISNQTGFLSGQELGYLTQVLRYKPPFNPEKPLEHILFIQSHCHPALSEENIKQTRIKCFKRLNKEGAQLKTIVFDSWIEDGAIKQAPTSEELIARTHPFWRENEKYRENITKQIADIISFLNNEQEKMVKKTLNSVTTTAQNLLKAVICDLEMKKSDTNKRVKEVEEKDARFRRESHELTKQFNELIKSCKQEKVNDLSKIKEGYERVVSIPNITQGKRKLLPHTLKNIKIM